MAEQVARETEDAYSYDRYTPSGWRQCCLMLAKRGYGPKAIEAIMRSKWTRWAGDSDEKRRYGQLNSKTLERFMDSMGPRELEREVNNLILGTFGSHGAVYHHSA